MNKILTKKEFYSRSKAGVLGNTFRMWDNFDDWAKSGYLGPITLRSRIPDSQYFIPYLEFCEVFNKLAELSYEGVDISQFYFGEVPEQDFRLLQCEICDLPDGLSLWYTREQGNLRHALERSGKQVQGVMAKLIMCSSMDVNSYHDIIELLELYPGAAIECTVFDRQVGELPHRNTIIWEVRHY